MTCTCQLISRPVEEWPVHAYMFDECWHHACWHCGETIGNAPAAEIYRPADVTVRIMPGGHSTTEASPSRLVHAEPCATDLLSRGWEIA